MGYRFADQYSLLHFASGVMAYFLGLNLPLWLLLHILFEIVENTEQGIKFISHNLSYFWPGGKSAPDSVINRVGDTVFAVIGWECAKQLDIYGRKHNWFINPEKTYTPNLAFVN